jgi:hypothetical protein
MSDGRLQLRISVSPEVDEFTVSFESAGPVARRFVQRSEP